MDIATVIGIVLGSGLVLGSIIMGGPIGPFINIPSGMIVFGGSISACLMNFTLAETLGVVGVVKNCFFLKLPEPTQCIDQFKEFATLVRKDGILALEDHIGDITDPFLKRGLEMVVGGGSKDVLTATLETEIAYIEQRHLNGKKILESTAAAAPAFGMIGTLIGLVQMLRTLDDPSKIGGGMATALLTTLYGAVVANMFCIPLAGKLEARNSTELMIRELMLTGLLGLVDGQTPSAMEEALVAFIEPGLRPSTED